MSEVEDQKCTNLYVAERIEQEGLDYAVRHYMSSDNFEDRKTAELWDAAEKALNDLMTHLVNNGAKFLEDI